jgi:flavin reductase (DIM6/NTAB) family NADH-FMN oxidoreductase RutF
MIVELENLSPNRAYFTLIQAVVPRPIAWVLSPNGDDSHNLAPFSYFNLVCSDPPLLMLSIGKKADGAAKDTRRNIIERGAFVVHIAHAEQAHLVSESSVELPAGESELTRLQLPTVPFGSHPVPRLRDCRIAFACERYQVIELGPLPQALILGRITSVYIDDAIAVEDEKGRLSIDIARLNPLSRLGGDQYAELGTILDIPRPKLV